MNIALLHNRLRVEERMLIDVFAERAIAVEAIDLREVTFSLDSPGRFASFDIVLDRSLSLTASTTAVRILELHGIRCINSAHTIETCSDKLRTSIALQAAGIPEPRVVVATDPESALAAVEQIGYPAVIKPTIGSWGRMVSRVNDRDAAEAIIEHRFTLGSIHHHVLYVQEHINKPGRDIRVFVVGGNPIAAIVRNSQHWVTNTARGATAAGFSIGPEMEDLTRRAAHAVAGDIVAIDLLECPKRGLLVNEINHSMEFRNSVDTTGVNIPGLVADHVIALAQRAVACRHGVPSTPTIHTRAATGALST